MAGQRFGTPLQLLQVTHTFIPGEIKSNGPPWIVQYRDVRPAHPSDGVYLQTRSVAAHQGSLSQLLQVSSQIISQRCDSIDPFSLKAGPMIDGNAEILPIYTQYGSNTVDVTAEFDPLRDLPSTSNVIVSVPTPVIEDRSIPQARDSEVGTRSRNGRPHQGA